MHKIELEQFARRRALSRGLTANHTDLTLARAASHGQFFAAKGHQLVPKFDSLESRAIENPHGGRSTLGQVSILLGAESDPIKIETTNLSSLGRLLRLGRH